MGEPNIIVAWSFDSKEELNDEELNKILMEVIQSAGEFFFFQEKTKKGPTKVYKDTFRKNLDNESIPPEDRKPIALTRSSGPTQQACSVGDGDPKPGFQPPDNEGDVGERGG